MVGNGNNEGEWEDLYVEGMRYSPRWRDVLMVPGFWLVVSIVVSLVV